MLDYSNDVNFYLILFVLICIMIFLIINKYDTDNNVDKFSKIIISTVSSGIISYAFYNVLYDPDIILTSNYWDNSLN